MALCVGTARAGIVPICERDGGALDDHLICGCDGLLDGMDGLELDDNELCDPLDFLLRIAPITDCRLVPGDVQVPFGDCVDFRLIVTLGPLGSFDVTDRPETTFMPSPLFKDPDNCVVQTGRNRFCVRADAPASCIGRQIFITAIFDSPVRGCNVTGCIVPSGLDVNRNVGFILNPGFHLVPADCTLRTVTINPILLDPTLAGSTVQLTGVTSNSFGDPFTGIQPEFVIIKDTATPASPNLVVQLRACLNFGGRRRVYTLTFKVTRPDGVMGVGTIQVDVPVCCRIRGLDF